MWTVNFNAWKWLAGAWGYGVRIGDALSQLINVVVFFSDNPNESVSARAHRQRRTWFWGWMEAALDFVFLPMGPNHCQRSHEADVARASKLLKSSV